MLGTTSRALAGGWGHVASSEEGLAVAQCSPGLQGLGTPPAQGGPGDAHSPQDATRGLRRVGTCGGPHSHLFWGWVGMLSSIKHDTVGSGSLFVS